jgi:hypothetical protein
VRIAIASEYPIRRLAVFAGHNEKVHVSDLGGCSDMDCGESLLIFVEGAGAGAPSGFISRETIPSRIGVRFLHLPNPSLDSPNVRPMSRRETKQDAY